MSEANVVYDQAGRIIATAKFGVAWSREPRSRLGEYDYGDQGRIYDNHSAVVGTFSSEGDVLDTSGAVIGRVLATSDVAFDLVFNGQTTARCIGCRGAAAAALLFLFVRRR